MPVCRETKPALAEVRPGRMVACHLYTKTTSAGQTGRTEAMNERIQQGEPA
jgi:oligopeptide transport system ATP-binding protein